GTDRVGAVGHLHPTGVATVGVAIGEIIDRVALAELEVDRLPAEQVTGAGHDVDRRDPAGAGLCDAGVAHVDRIAHAHVGLNGGRPVTACRTSDVTVRVHQTGHDHLARAIVPLGVG